MGIWSRLKELLRGPPPPVPAQTIVEIVVGDEDEPLSVLQQRQVMAMIQAAAPIIIQQATERSRRSRL